MTSKLEICNLALAQLGQAPISSLNQEDERASRLNLFYESVRDEVLRAHNWGFAGTEVPLTLVTPQEQITGGFLYKYPTHALFIRCVFDVQAPHQCLAFRTFFDENTQMRVLQAATKQAYAQYTRKITDETLFDASFVKVFSLALACNLATSLTADSQLATQLFEKYQLALREARQCNMSESFQSVVQKDCFTEVR